jgi:hypothetical protein
MLSVCGEVPLVQIFKLVKKIHLFRFVAAEREG